MPTKKEINRTASNSPYVSGPNYRAMCFSPDGEHFTTLVSTYMEE